MKQTMNAAFFCVKFEIKAKAAMAAKALVCCERFAPCWGKKEKMKTYYYRKHNPAKKTYRLSLRWIDKNIQHGS